jgi:hypothetical protein
VNGFWTRLQASFLGFLLPLRGQPPEVRQAFADRAAQLNQRRVRALMPVMVVIHALVGLGLVGSPGAVTGDAARWYQDLLTCHRTMLPVSIVLVGAGWLLPVGHRALRPLGNVTAGAYMAFAVAISLTDQRLFPSNVGGMIMAALGTAAFFRLGLLASVLIYVGAFIGLVQGLRVMGVGAEASSSAIATTVTVVLLAFALARAAVAAMAREFLALRTIEAQSAALAQANRELDELNHAQEKLNAELERRVAEQVGEIVVRAREVEALNAQLKERVKERSRELSMALARLAGDRQDAWMIAAGTVLGERVVIEGLLGKGGMGAVYLATDRVSGDRVAVKVVQAASSQELDGLHRFLHEANLTASLTHPAIVRSLHVDVSDDGRLFQVLELVHGETLSSVLARVGSLRPGAAARIGQVMAEALAAAHAAGVVHRDVKPGNIMLTAARPGVKLLDFGVARAMGSRRPDSSPVASGSHPSTRIGFIVGTPEYMAPEQASSSGGPVGEPADVYALGLVVYVMLAGRSPFAAASPTAFLHAHASEAPRPLAELRTDVPPRLVALVSRCLAKTPAERPTAAELARELGTIADGLGAPPADHLNLAERESKELGQAATLAVAPVSNTAETKDGPRK